jgi:hypothetical protein
VVTRRRLLLAGFAGGATIVAGCGKDEVAAVPSASEALRRVVRAESALAAAVRTQASLEGALLERIGERADGRAGRAIPVLQQLGGPRAELLELDEPVGDPLERGRAALEADVAALPSLTDRDLRDLGALLVEGCAADLALLESVLGPVSGDAFPGTPS